MFNDKLHIFTYKNTIDQSQLKLLAIFCQSLFSSTVRFPTEDIFINKPIPHVRTSSYRGGVILIDLN